MRSHLPLVTIRIPDNRHKAIRMRLIVPVGVVPVKHLRMVDFIENAHAEFVARNSETGLL